MTDSEFGAERTQDDPIEGAAPVDDETPGEYEPSDQSGGQSVDTGVTYDRTGEPEITPNDLEVAQAKDEDEETL
jgi:hypothetical protein